MAHTFTHAESWCACIVPAVCDERQQLNETYILFALYKTLEFCIYIYRRVDCVESAFANIVRSIVTRVLCFVFQKKRSHYVWHKKQFDEINVKTTDRLMGWYWDLKRGIQTESRKHRQAETHVLAHTLKNTHTDTLHSVTCYQIYTVGDSVT